MGHTRPAPLPASRPRSRGVGEQSRQRLGPSPLPRGADALGLVARAAGCDQVARRGRTSARSRRDMVHLGGLIAAVAAGPAVAVQNGTAQQRVDSPLGGIARGGIPVQEWVGEIGNHSMNGSPCRSALQLFQTRSAAKGFGPKPNLHPVRRPSKSSATPVQAARARWPRPAHICSNCCLVQISRSPDKGSLTRRSSPSTPVRTTACSP